jgi:hypothetical protein
MAKLLNACHILGKFIDKGIEDNTQFLKGGQCNNPLKSDKGQARKRDGDLGGVVCKFYTKLKSCNNRLVKHEGECKEGYRIKSKRKELVSLFLFS